MYKSFPFFAYSFLCWMDVLRFQVSLLFSYTEHVTQAVNVSNGASRSAQGQTTLPLVLTPRKWLCRCSSVCPTWSMKCCSYFWPISMWNKSSKKQLWNLYCKHEARAILTASGWLLFQKPTANFQWDWSINKILQNVKSTL